MPVADTGRAGFPLTRMRRMRRDEFSRRLMRETRLMRDDLSESRAGPMIDCTGVHAGGE
jgi:hypothetical protein